jgi:hypothetical protein
MTFTRLEVALIGGGPFALGLFIGTAAGATAYWS